MAQPARVRTPPAENPANSPAAVDRAYHAHRAQRAARLERQRLRRRARVRFVLILGGLVLAILVILVTIWSEIQKVFGI